MTVSTDNLDDLLAPAVIANPYATYARLREIDPIHWNPLFNAWVVTRYDDVQAMLQDPRIRSGWGLSRPVQTQTPEDQAALEALTRFRSLSIAGQDGPDHRRLRALISKAFTPNMVERMRGFIQEQVDLIVDEAQKRGGFEVMHDLGMHLPGQVIFHLCGVPEELHDDFVRSANILAVASGLGDLAPGELATLTNGALAVMQDVYKVIDDQAANPQDNLIGRLLQAEENGQIFSREELCNFIYGLLLGGSENTARIIANGLLALLRNPDQLALLRKNPELIDSAVEEIIRFDPPVTMNFRTPSEDILVRGHTIKAGDLIFLSLGAANRDPEQFPDPDRFDITRQPNRHLAFGYGAHYCIGAPLSRLENKIVFETIVQRLPGLRLTDAELEWNPNFIMRDLKALHVTFDRQF
ncbi:MAG: cytochrome P450 [Roseiflexaceae bacterium]